MQISLSDLDFCAGTAGGRSGALPSLRKAASSLLAQTRFAGKGGDLSQRTAAPRSIEQQNL